MNRRDLCPSPPVLCGTRFDDVLRSERLEDRELVPDRTASRLRRVLHPRADHPRPEERQLVQLRRPGIYDIKLFSFAADHIFRQNLVAVSERCQVT